MSNNLYLEYAVDELPNLSSNLNYTNATPPGV